MVVKAVIEEHKIMLSTRFPRSASLMLNTKTIFEIKSCQANLFFVPLWFWSKWVKHFFLAFLLSGPGRSRLALVFFY